MSWFLCSIRLFLCTLSPEEGTKVIVGRCLISHKSFIFAIDNCKKYNFRNEIFDQLPVELQQELGQTFQINLNFDLNLYMTLLLTDMENNY